MGRRTTASCLGHWHSRAVGGPGACLCPFGVLAVAVWVYYSTVVHVAGDGCSRVVRPHPVSVDALPGSAALTVLLVATAVDVDDVWFDLTASPHMHPSVVCHSVVCHVPCVTTLGHTHTTPLSSGMHTCLTPTPLTCLPLWVAASPLFGYCALVLCPCP